MIRTQVGELVVGAYLRLVEGCELVSYNQRSTEAGRQMELDVLAVESSDGARTVYACEVVTHLRGLHYSGTPESDDWAAFGGPAYQYSLERLRAKFHEDLDLVTDVFDDADRYVLQLWSPVVPEGGLTDGLAELQRRFEAETGARIDLVVNETYTDRVEELRSLAAGTHKNYDEPAFRFLQILEHLR